MKPFILVLLSAICGCYICQQGAQYITERHPEFTTYICDGNSVCLPSKTSIVLDANWRWIHNNNGYDNCLPGSHWHDTYCSSPTSCASNCHLEGVDYEATYGVHATSSELSLRLKTGDNIGSRIFLLEGDEYKKIHLANQEVSFEVDMSRLPCGTNGAVYLVDMDADGGLSYSGNNAGAAYGTGYCDAQCPKDIKFINGEANNLDGSDFTNGGHYGSCCFEFDLWEANSASTAFTSHLCDYPNLYRCQNSECSGTSGVCDGNGCDLNPYRIGNTKFLGGEGDTDIDTSQPFTVLTQFVTEDCSEEKSDLVEVRRYYIQNGSTWESPPLGFAQTTNLRSLSDAYCAEKTRLFGEDNNQLDRGGMEAVGQALKRGMVLAMSVWVDHSTHMKWLDGRFPIGADPSIPGVARGTCQKDERDLTEDDMIGSVFILRNIRYGPIGSTVDLNNLTHPPTVSPAVEPKGNNPSFQFNFSFFYSSVWMLGFSILLILCLLVLFAYLYWSYIWRKIIPCSSKMNQGFEPKFRFHTANSAESVEMI